MQKICALVLLLFIYCASSQQTLPTFESWEGIALSAPRTNVVALTVKNYAIFAGGQDKEGLVSDVVDILDVTARKVSTTKLSSARTRLLSASVGSYALFAAGYEVVNETTQIWQNTVDILDVDTMEWRTSQLPNAFGFQVLVAATKDNRFVFFNGTFFAFFDPSVSNDTAWTQIKLTTIIIGHRSMVMTDTAIFIARPNLYMISFNATNGALLPTPIVSPGVSVAPLTAQFFLNNVIYFATASNLLLYFPELNQWTGTLFPEYGAQGAVPFQGGIIGYKADRLFFFNTNLLTWDTREVDLPVNGSSVTVVADKYIVIAGGYGADGQLTTSLHVLAHTSTSPPVASAPVSVSEPPKSGSEPDSDLTAAATVSSVSCLVFSIFALALL